MMAGVIAAVALAFSLAETVVASTCAPMPDMWSIAAGDTEDVPVGDDCMRMLHGQREGDRGGRHCPFGPVAGVPGCAAAASVPARTLEVLTPSSESVMTIASDATHHNLLLATALFHPPKS